MIGTELDGRYRIDAELGAGGAGTVYRGSHLALGKPVAIKVLRPELSHSAALRQRFEREARALAALTHPNIVGIVDSGVAADSLYLVMDLLEGETLSRRLEAGPIPLREAVTILRQLLAALVYVHEQGLIHRDVKPANVFLEVAAPGQAQNVRLLDFGLAKFIAPEVEDRALTRAGQVFGTPAYMAPEQIAGQAADARADVYATGIVFFTMLAGRTPFQGDDSEVLRKHVMDDLPVSALPSASATPEIVALLRRATAKTRAERFANAREMLDALDAAVRALPKPAGADDPTLDADTALDAAEPTRGSRLFRLGATVALVISGLALVAAAVSVYVLVSPSRQSERRKLEAALSLPPPRGAASAADKRAPTPSATVPVRFAAPPPAGSAVPVAVPSGAPPVAAPPPSASPPDAPRPPPQNPWLHVPPELAKFVSKVNHGRNLDKREIVAVHQYNAKHPDDPRGHLLLGRAYLARHWVKDAVSEDEIALGASNDARADPRLLPDLVKLVLLGSNEAARLLVQTYPDTALPAIERGLAVPSNPEARARLEHVRDELAAHH